MAPGDALTLELRMDGQVTPESTHDDLLELQAVSHVLTGPVAVRGAEPGDLLELEILGELPVRAAQELHLVAALSRLRGAAAAAPGRLCDHRHPIDRRGGERFDFEQACALASVAAELRISQAVDLPNPLVSAVLPLEVLQR